MDLDDAGRVDALQPELQHHDGGVDALVRRPRRGARAHRGAKRRNRIRVGKLHWSQKFCISARAGSRVKIWRWVFPRGTISKLLVT